MAKTRSPNYPNYDLEGALGLVDKVFAKDGRNKVSRAALATHLGHEGLSGPALGKIGALRAYGLLDGNGDELRVSDAAIAALKAPQQSRERKDALKQLALKPTLFQMIKQEYPTIPSAENLEYWLVKQGFSQTAASIAASSYLTTMKLVEGLDQNYDEENSDEGRDQMQSTPNSTSVGGDRPPAPKAGQQRADFPLQEGIARIEFPSNMSADSYDDLEAWLQLVLRRAKRDVKAN